MHSYLQLSGQEAFEKLFLEGSHLGHQGLNPTVCLPQQWFLWGTWGRGGTTPIRNAVPTHPSPEAMPFVVQNGGFKIIQVNAPKPKSTNNNSLQVTNPMQNQSIEATPAQDCSLNVCAWNLRILSWPQQGAKGLRNDKSNAPACKSTNNSTVPWRTKLDRSSSMRIPCPMPQDPSPQTN